MSEYTGPIQEIPSYDAKFIRMGNRLFTTGPDDIETSHQDLASTHAILTLIKELRLSDPRSVDAGYYSVENSEKLITVTRESERLMLPIHPEARSLTLVDFKKHSPGYEVEAV